MKRRWTKTAVAVSVFAMALLGHRSLVTAQPLMCANCVGARLASNLVPPQIQPPLKGDILYQTQQTWLQPAKIPAASVGLIRYCVYPNFKVGVSSSRSDTWTTPFTLALLGGRPALQPVHITGPIKPDTTTLLTPSPKWCVDAPADQPPVLTLVTRFPEAATTERKAPVVFGPQPARPVLMPRPANPTN